MLTLKRIYTLHDVITVNMPTEIRVYAATALRHITLSLVVCRTTTPTDGCLVTLQFAELTEIDSTATQAYIKTIQALQIRLPLRQKKVQHKV